MHICFLTSLPHCHSTDTTWGEHLRHHEARLPHIAGKKNVPSLLIRLVEDGIFHSRQFVPFATYDPFLQLRLHAALLLPRFHDVHAYLSCTSPHKVASLASTNCFSNPSHRWNASHKGPSPVPLSGHVIALPRDLDFCKILFELGNVDSKTQALTFQINWFSKTKPASALSLLWAAKTL